MPLVKDAAHCTLCATTNTWGKGVGQETSSTRGRRTTQNVRSGLAARHSGGRDHTTKHDKTTILVPSESRKKPDTTRGKGASFLQQASTECAADARMHGACPNDYSHMAHGTDLSLSIVESLSRASFARAMRSAINPFLPPFSASSLSGSSSSSSSASSGPEPSKVQRAVVSGEVMSFR